MLRAYFETDTTDEQIKALTERAIVDLREAGATIVDPFELPQFERRRGGRRNNFRYDLNNYLSTLGGRRAGAHAGPPWSNPASSMRRCGGD